MKRVLRALLITGVFASLASTAVNADEWHCNCSSGDLVCTIEGPNGEDRGWLHWPNYKNC